MLGTFALLERLRCGPGPCAVASSSEAGPGPCAAADLHGFVSWAVTTGNLIGFKLCSKILDLLTSKFLIHLSVFLIHFSFFLLIHLYLYSSKGILVFCLLCWFP